MNAGSKRVYTLIVKRPLVGAEALNLCHDLQALPIREFHEVEFSLKHVERIDVSGIAALVRLYSNLVRGGRTLRLTDVPHRVMRVLVRSGLAGVLPVDASELAVGEPALTTDSGLFTL